MLNIAPANTPNLFDLERGEYLTSGRKRPREVSNYVRGGLLGAGALAYADMARDMYRTHMARRRPAKDEWKEMEPRRPSHKYIMPRFGTTQRDAKKLYSKRRRTKRGRRKIRRKAKRMRSFKNKVRRIIYNDLGEFNFQFNQLTTSNAAEGQQNWVPIFLNGYAGNSSSGGNQIKTMVKTLLTNQPRTVLTGAPNLTVQPENISARLRKAVLDCTVTNTGVNAIEMDVYECYFKRHLEHPTLASFTGQLVSDTAVTRNSSNSANLTEISVFAPGTTPFDLSGFGRYIKIQNVTRLYIKPGDSTSFVRKGRMGKQITDEMMTQAAASADNCVARAGLTKMFLFKYAGVPNSVALSSAAVISIASNYHYSWNVLQNQMNYDALI